MSKLIRSQWVTSAIATARPWLLGVALILLLRYTGALGGILTLTQSAMLQTGMMDFKPAESFTAPSSFDYNFKLRTLDGKVVDASTFKGKVLFINLWATWCGPCRAEMPSIQQLYHTADTARVAFVMLSLDAPDNRAKVVRYVKDNNFSFPVYLQHLALPKQLVVRSIPTTFIVGTDGKIKSKKSGAANYDTDEFRAYLRKLAE